MVAVEQGELEVAFLSIEGALFEVHKVKVVVEDVHFIWVYSDNGAARGAT